MKGPRHTRWTGPLRRAWASAPSSWNRSRGGGRGRSTVGVQGHFTAPAKRLRADHRLATAARQPHGRFVPSDGRAVLTKASGAPPDGDPCWEVVDMQTEPAAAVAVETRAD